MNIFSEQKKGIRLLVPMFLFFAALLSSLWGLWRMEFTAMDSRFALFVRETLSAPFASFPRLYGSFYPDYTSIPTYLSGWAMQMFGDNMFGLVFPTAFAGALVVLFTYLLGCRLVSMRFGLAGALLIFSAFEYLKLLRVSSMDLYVAACAVISVYCAVVADQRKKQWISWFFLPLLLICFCARGPIGILVMTAVLLMYYLIERRWFRFFLNGFLAGLILAGCMALLAQRAYAEGGETFFQIFWHAQIGSRFSSVRSPLYYFTNGIGAYAFTFPLSVFVLTVYAFRFKLKLLFPQADPRMKDLQFLFLWSLVIILGLSIPGTKHTRYILSVVPSMALIAAYFFENPHHCKLITYVRKYFVFLLGLYPFLLIPATLILWGVVRFFLSANPRFAGVSIPLTVPLILEVLLAVFVYFVWKRAHLIRADRNLLILAAAVFGIVILKLACIDPIETASTNTREFVCKAEAVRIGQGAQPMVFAALGPDGDENNYMVYVDRGHFFKPLYEPSWNPEDWKTAYPEKTCFLIRRNRFERLAEPVRGSFRILCEGYLGRRDVLLIQKTVSSDAPAVSLVLPH